MRVAIDDDDEEQGDASIERDADATFVAEASDEILSIRQQLAATTLERDTLFTRLQATHEPMSRSSHSGRPHTRMKSRRSALELRKLSELRLLPKTAPRSLSASWPMSCS